jgi:hypothetical protein
MSKSLAKLEKMGALIFRGDGQFGQFFSSFHQINLNFLVEVFKKPAGFLYEKLMYKNNGRNSKLKFCILEDTCQTIKIMHYFFDYAKMM